MRGVAAIWSPRLNSSARVCNNLIHITDWLPTLYIAAQGNSRELKEHDGVNQWNMLMNKNEPPARNKLLLNMDEISRTEGAILDKYKLIRGTIII